VTHLIPAPDSQPLMLRVTRRESRNSCYTVPPAGVRRKPTRTNPLDIDLTHAISGPAAVAPAWRQIAKPRARRMRMPLSPYPLSRRPAAYCMADHSRLTRWSGIQTAAPADSVWPAQPRLVRPYGQFEHGRVRGRQYV
jgi:hypothetical protein